MERQRQHDPAAAVEREQQALNVARIRQDFPMLQRLVNGKPLVWLDNSATTQKPASMIARLASFYTTQEYAKTQSSHTVGKQATEAFEATRSRIASHFNAARPEEIIFLRGATE